MKRQAWGLLLVAGVVLGGGLPVNLALAQPASSSADATKVAAMLDQLLEAWVAGRQPEVNLFAEPRVNPPSPAASKFGPVQAIRLAEARDGNYKFEVDHANMQVEWFLYLDESSGLIRGVGWTALPPFPGDTALAAPHAWGPLAGLANQTVWMRDSKTYYRVSSDGSALYALLIGPTGHTTPSEVIRLVGDGTFVRRRYLFPGMRRDTFYRGEAMDGQTVRWGRLGQSQDYYHDWTIGSDGKVDTFTLTVYEFDEVTSSRPYWRAPKFYESQGFVEAAALMQMQDVGTVSQFNQRWADFVANNSGDSTNLWAKALYSGLSAGVDVARQSEARSRAQLDATVAQMRAQAAYESAASQGSTSNSTASTASSGGADTVAVDDGRPPADAGSPAAAKPLRFVLTISMRNLPGDAHNSMCYSNVVTRPGPPGWGASGFLPSGSPEQARAEIDSLRTRFIELCRASGRDITSEGNFSYVWNRGKDEDGRVDATAPRHAEDVAVSLP